MPSAVAEAGKYRRAYGIITPEIIDELFDKRMLAADLLSRSDTPRQSHAAKMVLITLDTLKAELEGLIA